MVQAVPGDAVRVAVGMEGTKEQVDRIKQENGLDKPLLVQLRRYVEHALQGDFGRSYVTHQPVSDLVRERVGSSLELAATAFGLVLCYCRSRSGCSRRARRERGGTGSSRSASCPLTSVLGAVPELLSATVLVFVFAVKLRLLPVGGAGELRAS